MSQTKAQLIDPVDLSIVTADLADDAVTAAKLASNAVVNASVDSSASIAGTKISPNFGSQDITTTGNFGAASVTITDNSPSLIFTDSNANSDFRIRVQSGVLKLRDDTNGADRLTIASDGSTAITQKLGIGTSTPEEILHIKGPTETIGSRDGVLLQHSTASNAADNGLPLVWSGYISSSNTNYGLASICGRKENSTDNNGAAYLQFGTGSSAGAISERMRLSSTGQLLIGTTSSSYKLHVDAADRAAEISVDNDSSNYLVSINSTNSVNADFNIQHKTSLTSIGTGVNIPLCFHISGGTNANSAEKMRLDTSGRLGIGTDSPSQRLEVSGNIKVTSGLLVIDNDQRIQFGSSNVAFIEGNDNSKLTFGVASEGMRLDSGNKLLHGVTSSVDVCSVAPARLQVHNNNSVLTMSLTGYGNNAGGAILALGHSRSSTVGTATGALVSGDTCGDIRFGGSDGTDMENTACAIRGEVDGSVSSNTVPGRLVFTTNAGSGSTEHVRITSAGQFRAGDECTSNRTSYRHQLSSTAGSGDVLSLQNPSNSDGQGIGLGFWARNTNNAAIEVAKLKAVVDETQANSTQKGSLRFLTNVSASMAERMRIHSNGFVGIGLTNPNTMLDVNGVGTFRVANSATYQAGFNVTNSVTTDLQIWVKNNQVALGPSTASDINLVTQGNGNTRMLIQHNGNVGIGTTSISDDADHCKLAIAGQSGSAAGILVFQATNGDEDGMVFADGGNLFVVADRANASSSSSIRFRVDGSSEKMRLLSNGKLLLNRTNEDGSGVINLALNGSGHGISTRTASNSTQTHLDFGNQNGIVGSIQTSSSSTGFNTSSDYRLKENAVAISDGITRLKTLKPYRFNWKADSSTKVDGFFAHEVTAVPEAISGTKDAVDKDNNPVYQQIDQSKLVPLLVAAVQELIGRVETLEAA